jgi:hypothetical protein
MTEDLEKILLRIDKGQESFTRTQEEVAQLSRSTFNDVSMIKDDIRRIYSKLNETVKNNTINTEAIKYLKEEQNKIDSKIKNASDGVQKNIILKLYTSLLTSVGAFITAIITAVIVTLAKTKI